MMYFRIDIEKPLTNEQIEYIFDCWISFITNDLGFAPSDLPIYLQQEKTINHSAF